MRSERLGGVEGEEGFRVGGGGIGVCGLGCWRLRVLGVSGVGGLGFRVQRIFRVWGFLLGLFFFFVCVCGCWGGGGGVGLLGV